MTTVKTVAKVAGVSAMTVSRVINNPNSVSPHTREKVEQAMKKLKYVPNAAAKNLVTNRSGIVDVYVPENIDLSNPFVMYFIAGISQVLSEQMYSFLILRNRRREHRCDGYIVTGLLRDEINEFARYAGDRGRPLALFGHTELPNLSCIDVNNVLGAKMGTEHLISLGHEKIAMVNVAEDKDYTVDRLNGYKDAMKEHGLSFNESTQVIYTENSAEGGVIAAQKLLEQDEYTAAFCATDTIAIGVASELARSGKNIPKDFSLVGFDGLGHQLLSTPQLTSVQQPVYDIGKMLAKALLDRINGKTEQIKQLVDPILLEGKSTAPLRA